ncbi:uncharacterized protein LOC127791238 [Diospyros lotus]|uniref:uncharacterized protein LOC127791238 n=1 Tax=Diospyros lotus TaxID=55363 RepID=UPI0022516348|nr:uncharacterized protein LOC127791238 [Diospyros lotus]XP_052177056.1 uncharacterized protein LOC127791238 [Diospyros lotus]
MDEKGFLQGNRIEDVRWLCSLSESELDMLISLKKMVVQRAKVIGHESLAKKFDLKMYRALGFIFLEHLKEQLKDVSATPGLNKSSGFLDRCNLLNSNLNDSFGTMSLQELRTYVGADQRKRIAEIFVDDEAPDQKKKAKSKNSF